MRKTVDRIVSYAAKLTEPEMIILFGSIANGTCNVYSDIDLLIIRNEKDTGKVLACRIASYAHELALSSDILIYSAADIQAALKDNDSFLAGVVNHGIVVYKKDV